MEDYSFIIEAMSTAFTKLRRFAQIPYSEFPHVTDKSGRWQCVDPGVGGSWDEHGWHHGHWTGGFWPGMLWLAYDVSKKSEFRKWAERDVKYFLSRSNDESTHDIGFLIYPTFGLGLEITQNKEYKQVVLTAAETLARRYVSTGGYLTAWGPPSEPRSKGTSAIDTMMNLPLLFQAFRYTENKSFLDIATRHALTSAAHYVEKDGRTCHIIAFDEKGNPVKKGTFQGLSEDSCWSRGLSWAIAGFAFAYREAADARFLRAFENTSRYYMEHTSQSLIPKWDFADERKNALLDSSAAAITSYGMLIMSDCHPDRDLAAYYKSAATRILRNLSTDYLNQNKGTDGILLHSCYSVPHNEGVDSATVFGDFYYLLSMVYLYKRSLQPNFFT